MELWPSHTVGLTLSQPLFNASEYCLPPTTTSALSRLNIFWRRSLVLRDLVAEGSKRPTSWSKLRLQRRAFGAFGAFHIYLLKYIRIAGRVRTSRGRGEYGNGENGWGQDNKSPRSIEHVGTCIICK